MLFNFNPCTPFVRYKKEKANNIVTHKTVTYQEYLLYNVILLAFKDIIGNSQGTCTNNITGMDRYINNE